MMNWVCRKLAECFNAHLSDEEQEARRILILANEKIRELDTLLNSLPKKCELRTETRRYGKRDLEFSKDFRIVAVSGSFSTYKEL
jgi:hypothetical protein